MPPLVNPTLGHYLRREVAAFSPHYGPLLRAAGAGTTAPWGPAALGALPTTTLDQLPAKGELVLRPDADSILRGGSRVMAGRLAFSRIMGRQGNWGRAIVDPLFKPVHWTLDGDFLVGWTATDLDRLSELGRRWLESVGVVPDDVLVSVVDAGPRLGFWELVLGARRGGVSALFLDVGAAADEVAALWPTVVAGSAADLLRLARGGDLPAVRIAIVVGELVDDDTRAALTEALPHREATVVAAWAPPGVRSLWTECRPGSGLHLHEDADLVEAVDGEVVWSGLGWRGTVVLRLRTGVAADLETGPCPSCGQRGVRVMSLIEHEPRTVDAISADVPAPEPEPTAATASDPMPVSTLDDDAVLDLLEGDERILTFQAERRGGDLIVYLAVQDDEDLAAVLRTVDRSLHATQYVVLADDEVEDRIDAHDGQELVTVQQ